MPFFFARGYTPVPQPTEEAGDVVREVEIVWRYVADSNGGTCPNCEKSLKQNDRIISVGKKDCEGRTSYHEGCWEEAA
jgi:hypothetical protein